MNWGTAISCSSPARDLIVTPTVPEKGSAPRSRRAARGVRRGRWRCTGFAKAHVLGNTYVVLVEPRGYGFTAQRIRRICSSCGGVGGHGVVVGRNAEPFSVRVYNADGSRAETSGNGLRIYGWWMIAQGLGPTGGGFTLQSMGRQYPLCVRSPLSGAVGVDLGLPHVAPVHGTWWRAFPQLRAARYVRVGNPHLCFEIGDAADQFPLRELAALGERDGGLPGGANVEVYVRSTSSTIETRIWERGVGETPSSGSGSAAAAVAAWDTGAEGRYLRVQMPGGCMEVRRSDDARVWSWGVVEEICRGELALP